MTLPFTTEQFYEVFVHYNEAIWPMQIALYGVAFAVLVLMIRRRPADSRFVAAGLAFLMAWAATAYYLVFFTRLNASGWVFGSVILAGGLWLGWVGAVNNRIQFDLRGDRRGKIAAALIAYALVIYPLIGYAVGHRYPAAPTFGAPCPVTIFTVGLLMMTKSPVPRSVFIVPMLWGLFGGVSATFQLGVYQDAGLLVAGLISLVMIAMPARAAAAPPTATARA